MHIPICTICKCHVACANATHALYICTLLHINVLCVHVASKLKKDSEKKLKIQLK